MACLGLDSEASCGPMAPATRTSRHRWGRGRNKACLLVSYRPLASRACAAAALAACGHHSNRIATPVYIAAAITSTSTTTAKRFPKLSNLTL